MKAYDRTNKVLNVIDHFATQHSLLALRLHRYTPEGNMAVCGTDYLSKDMLSRSYVFFYSIACYFAPLLTIIYCYWFIVAAVSAHENNMRAQAKKMNVASLRTAENSASSAEFKLAKVYFTKQT